MIPKMLTKIRKTFWNVCTNLNCFRSHSIASLLLHNHNQLTQYTFQVNKGLLVLNIDGLPRSWRKSQINLVMIHALSLLHI